MSNHIKLLNLLYSPIGIIGLVSLCITIVYIFYNIYWTLKDQSKKIDFIMEVPSIVYILINVIILESIIWFFAELVIIFIKL